MQLNLEKYSENKARRINNTFGIFVQALMWFMDNEDLYEKLGVIRLLLCNINQTSDPETRQKVESMIDETNKLLDNCKDKPPY